MAQKKRRGARTQKQIHKECKSNIFGQHGRTTQKITKTTIWRLAPHVQHPVWRVPKSGSGAFVVQTKTDISRKCMLAAFFCAPRIVPCVSERYWPAFASH